jgi:hypothetical protein
MRYRQWLEMRELQARLDRSLRRAFFALLATVVLALLMVKCGWAQETNTVTTNLWVQGLSPSTNPLCISSTSPVPGQVTNVGCGGPPGTGTVLGGPEFALGGYTLAGTNFTVGPAPNLFALSPAATATAVNALLSGLSSGTVIIPQGFPQIGFTPNYNVTTQDNRVGATYLTINGYGVACDERNQVVTLTSGQTAATSSGGFSAADIGKTILAAGTFGGTQYVFAPTISGYVSATQVTLSTAAPFSPKGSYTSCSVTGSTSCNVSAFNGFNGGILVGNFDRLQPIPQELSLWMRTASGTISTLLYVTALTGSYATCSSPGTIINPTIALTSTWTPFSYPIDLSSYSGCDIGFSVGPSTSGSAQVEISSPNFVPAPGAVRMGTTTYTEGAACPSWAMVGWLLSYDGTNLWACGSGSVIRKVAIS